MVEKKTKTPTDIKTLKEISKTLKNIEKILDNIWNERRP